MSDLPDVYTETFPVSRNVHICYECGREIAKGVKYHNYKGCWEGKFSGFKTCYPCHELRGECVDPHEPNEWPPFGSLSEWAYELGLEFPPTL